MGKQKKAKKAAKEKKPAGPHPRENRKRRRALSAASAPGRGDSTVTGDFNLIPTHLWHTAQTEVHARLANQPLPPDDDEDAESLGSYSDGEDREDENDGTENGSSSLGFESDVHGEPETEGTVAVAGALAARPRMHPGPEPSGSTASRVAASPGEPDRTFLQAMRRVENDGKFRRRTSSSVESNERSSSPPLRHQPEVFTAGIRGAVVKADTAPEGTTENTHQIGEDGSSPERRSPPLQGIRPSSLRGGAGTPHGVDIGAPVRRRGDMSAPSRRLGATLPMRRDPVEDPQAIPRSSNLATAPAPLPSATPSRTGIPLPSAPLPPPGRPVGLASAVQAVPLPTSTQPVAPVTRILQPPQPPPMHQLQAGLASAAVPTLPHSLPPPSSLQPALAALTGVRNAMMEANEFCQRNSQSLQIPISLKDEYHGGPPFACVISVICDRTGATVMSATGEACLQKKQAKLSACNYLMNFIQQSDPNAIVNCILDANSRPAAPAASGVPSLTGQTMMLLPERNAKMDYCEWLQAHQEFESSEIYTSGPPLFTCIITIARRDDPTRSRIIQFQGDPKTNKSDAKLSACEKVMAYLSTTPLR